MKKLTQFIAIVLLMVCSLCLFSCDKPAEDVVITVDATKMEIEDKTLKDYMDYLVSEGELSYLVSNGMITMTSFSISPAWMTPSNARKAAPIMQ